MLERLGAPVTVLRGDGTLFWSRGMHCAMKRALEEGADFYLMVNDDVEFFPEAMDVMMRSYRLADGHCAIAGATKSRVTGGITYGGRRLKGQELILPGSGLQRCDLANWNCFLIDDYAVKRVGLIDRRFEHGLGDFDYSLRLKAAGLPVYAAVDFVGFCESNPRAGTFHDGGLPRMKRFRLMLSRKNMPVRSRWHYYRKNFGVKGIGGFLWPYMKCSMCILLGKDY